MEYSYIWILYSHLKRWNLCIYVSLVDIKESYPVKNMACYHYNICIKFYVGRQLYICKGGDQNVTHGCPWMVEPEMIFSFPFAFPVLFNSLYVLYIIRKKQ